MLNTDEVGIRANNGAETIIDGKEYRRGTSNPTILNNTIKFMLTELLLLMPQEKKYVEDCKVIACENGYSLGSGKVVNSSADCAYVPMYPSTYEGDKGYDAEISILPATVPYYNGSRAVAYIGGGEHNITFKGGEEVVKEGLAIKVGGDKNGIRLMYGNLPYQNDFKASNFKLNNMTNFPVELSNKSSGVRVKSGGKVTDLGKNNKVTKIEVSKKD